MNISISKVKDQTRTILNFVETWDINVQSLRGPFLGHYFV